MFDHPQKPYTHDSIIGFLTGYEQVQPIPPHRIDFPGTSNFQSTSSVPIGTNVPDIHVH